MPDRALGFKICRFPHACMRRSADRSKPCVHCNRAHAMQTARRFRRPRAETIDSIGLVCVVARGNNIYSPVSWACDARSRLASGRRCGLFPVSLGETWAVGRQRRRRMHRSGHCHRKEVGQRAHWACIYYSVSPSAQWFLLYGPALRRLMTWSIGRPCHDGASAACSGRNGTHHIWISIIRV